MRTKPNFGKKDSFESQTKNDDSTGCIRIPLVIVVGYFVLSAITRVTSGGGSKLDQIICYGTLICFVIIMILGARDTYKDGQVAAAERQQWKKTCAFTDVAIVSRHHYPGGTYEDEYGIPHSSRPHYHLNLEMNADQKTVAPHQTVVRVDVHSPVYEKLEKRDTVRIYYKPESPLTFLLEEEL